MADEDQLTLYNAKNEDDLKHIFEKYDRYIADDDNEDEMKNEENIQKYRDLIKGLDIDAD